MSATAARRSPPASAPNGAPAIRTAQLSKRFGPVVALDRLDLEVPAGEVFGFLGPNGAGKSTTIRLLLGMLRASGGRAWLFGVDAADVESAHRHVAHVPADVALWPQLTGAECLELLAGVGPGTDVAYRDELVARFALDVDRVSRGYSSGNRQKVALVAAFSTRAPLLLLDEPTSGLDPLMEREFRRCIAEATANGQTVFLSSHQLGEVEALCHRVGILRHGRLVEVAGLPQLRRLRRREVTVTFTRPQTDERRLDAVDGVGDVRWPAPDRVLLSLAGSPAALLRALAADDVASLDVREPSLEEIFLDYYGDEATLTAATPDATTPR